MTAPCLRRYVKIHLIPLDASRACAFYCCTASEPQSQMTFNEGFCIPVPANTLAVCALQLCVCSLGPQAQEELLVGPSSRSQRDGCGSSRGVTVLVFPKGTAQLSLADCEGSAEMLYHWLRVQMLMEFPKYEQKNLSHRRHHDNQEEEQRLTTMVNKCIRCVSGGTEHQGQSVVELQSRQKFSFTMIV